MMRAGHDFIVKIGIQEAFQAGQAVGAAVGGERGVHKIAPVVIDGGKIAEDFAGVPDNVTAKIVCDNAVKLYGLDLN